MQFENTTPANDAAMASISSLDLRPFEWRDEYVLGHEGMDDMHREFAECVQAMLCADEANLTAALDAFEDHAHRHFGDEDEAMRRTAYGSAGCHLDEHAKVLASLEEVRIALAHGRGAVVRSFAWALADWFPGHAQVMDQGLARWLVQQRLGGSPMVIRRNAHALAHES